MRGFIAWEAQVSNVIMDEDALCRAFASAVGFAGGEHYRGSNCMATATIFKHIANTLILPAAIIPSEKHNPATNALKTARTKNTLYF